MSEQASGNFISVSERLKRFKPASGRRTVKHYPTGIKKLDQMLGGGLYAGLTFLGARPGMGKSTFALQIASEIAAAGSPVLFYSLEMPSVRMEAKILNRAIHMRYPNSSLTADWFLREENNTGKQKDWKLIEKVGKEISGSFDKMYIKERKKLSVSGRDVVQDVEMFMNEKKEKPVVFVDYLQILSSCTGNRNATERQKNDENINELSGLSNKYDLAVFVISSLNRESYREEQRSLRMDSFKETGGIEYSASVILGLQPRNIRQPKFNYEQEMSKEIREQEIVFLKQRYGISGMKANVSVDFHAAKDLYTEKGAFGKKSAQNVSRETKTDKKNTENANALPKKSGSASENTTLQDVKANADSLKNTETQALEAERPQTQNANLEYPDDPRARLEEEFRSLL